MYEQRKEKLKELLFYCACNQKIYQSEIAPKMKTSYRNIQRLLDQLEKEKLITATFEPSAKQGPGRKVWSITNDGLLYALMYQEVWDNFKGLAKAQADKMLLLKKLPLFEKTGIADYIKQLLLEAVRDYKMTVKAIGDVAVHPSTINLLVLSDAVFLPTEYMDKVRQTFKSDKELSAFINDYIIRTKDAAKQQLVFIEQREKAWLT